MADSSSPDFSILMDKPEGWADRTMTVYAKRGASGFDANVVLARDAMLPDEQFEAYAERQEKAFRGSLPDFRKERAQAGLAMDYPAHEILFTWRSGSVPLRQRAVFISIGRQRIVTFASTAAADDYAGMEDKFEKAFASLEIEGGEPPVAPHQFTS